MLVFMHIFSMEILDMRIEEKKLISLCGWCHGIPSLY